ncbi:adenine deaminase [Congregibacter litoralis]|uniref:Adenine deaminase n=1 Tax=Congregibacter litoralis KT71 TaxID=314285 RepID=A4A7B8_9GAMM|nr:adenine deaminase C-terminal domain-containing protein [Congregibacter litoralis]EAQ98187.2 Adenine deaminase [Congregibacter litoralis KT71]
MRILLVTLCLLSSQIFAQSLPGFREETTAFSAESETRRQLLQVSLGRVPADLLIRNVTLLNVFTGNWENAQDIAIAGDRIAWVGNSGNFTGKALATRDASGLWAVPGFGESHKHIESSYLTPEYEAELVVPFGSTWTVEGSHEISNVVGKNNVDFWLYAEDAGSPLKIFPAVGSATPPTVYESGGGYYGHDEMAAFMDRDLRVVGLGEVMDWTAVSELEAPGHKRIWGMMQATRQNRGVVEGHGAGLVTSAEINAFAAAGLSSDHEVRLPDEGLEKLRRGVFLEVKVRAMRDLFPFLIKEGISDWSNISVTTDDRDVHTTTQLGSMDYNIRSAIKAGVPTKIAYQLGSYNTARHFHIDHLVGSIAPGRFADIVLLTDPDTVAVESVYASGQLAAQNGKYLLDVPEIEYPSWATNTMNVGRKLTAKDFAMPAPSNRDEMDIAVLEPFYFKPELPKDTLAVTDGELHADPSRGISKVAMIDRYHGDAALSTMFWRNVGPVSPRSALASSQSHDLHNIWALGNDDAAMALAANTVAEMQGGWALVHDGVVVAKVRLEVAGLVSQRSVTEVGAEVEALFNAADQMEWIGNPGLPERMRFAFLTASPWKWQLVAPYADNPGGLVNITTGETHPVAW